MVAQLSQEESNNFVGLPCSLGEGNGRVAAQCALRFSKDSQFTMEEESAFASAMEELFKVECRRYGTSVDVREILRGILGQIENTKFALTQTMPPSLCKLFVYRRPRPPCLPQLQRP
jgi:hypothetical protein